MTENNLFCFSDFIIRREEHLLNITNTKKGEGIAVVLPTVVSVILTKSNKELNTWVVFILCMGSTTTLAIHAQTSEDALQFERKIKSEINGYIDSRMKKGKNR